MDRKIVEGNIGKDDGEWRKSRMGERRVKKIMKKDIDH